jgi:acetolactate synthase-1/2/3 large subunit
VLAIGPRLGEMTTSGYTLLKPPVPQQKLVHVHAGASELGRVYQGELLINASMPRFAEAAAATVAVEAVALGRATQAGAMPSTREPIPQSMPGRSTWRRWCHLHGDAADDAILTNGAGNYSSWVIASTSTEVPHATRPDQRRDGLRRALGRRRAITHPERTVVSFSGDGCFLMNGQEMATAVQYGAKVIFIVINNGIYGRSGCTRSANTRVVSGTTLHNPISRRWAAHSGSHGELITRTEELRPALERALAATGSTLLEIRIDRMRSRRARRFQRCARLPLDRPGSPLNLR